MNISEILNNYYTLVPLVGLTALIFSLLIIESVNKKQKLKNDNLLKEKLKAEKIEAERKAKEEQKRIEENARKAQEESEKKALEEQKRIEKETKKAQEESKRRLEEEKRKELEKLKLEEEDIQKRQELEKKLKEESERKALEEKKKIQEAAKKAKEEALLKAQEEQKKISEQKRKEKEESERKKEEELKKIEEKGKSFSEGLPKTKKSGFLGKLNNLFNEIKELDENFLDELEELLLTSDIGPKTSDTLFEKIKEGMDKKSIKDSVAVMDFLKKETYNILNIKFEEKSNKVPYIMLFIGVNGSGKTTTIGKIASQYAKQGKKVMLIAGDTFRAAAVEQLEVWAKRSGAGFHSGTDKQDPSSVIYDGIKKGMDEGYDVIIGDTSGRLHTDKKLMEELKKIKRSAVKAHTEAPHDVFLVLDSTNGQNAIHQVKYFNEAMDITGIVLTKMDGTAKGGVIIGISDTYKIPVRYVGIGEGINDLKKMNVNEFVEALYSND
jgi:fused signal recognition particle receptor